VHSALQGLGETPLVLLAPDVLLQVVMALLLCQQHALHPLLGCTADAVREINAHNNGDLEVNTACPYLLIAAWRGAKTLAPILRQVRW